MSDQPRNRQLTPLEQSRLDYHLEEIAGPLEPKGAEVTNMPAPERIQARLNQAMRGASVQLRTTPPTQEILDLAALLSWARNRPMKGRERLTLAIDETEWLADTDPK